MRPPPAVESSTLRHHGRSLLEERGREGGREGVEGREEGGGGSGRREGGRECPPPVQESSTVAGGGMHALVTVNPSYGYIVWFITVVLLLLLLNHCIPMSISSEEL